jgi:hypothetical protein
MAVLLEIRRGFGGSCGAALRSGLLTNGCPAVQGVAVVRGAPALFPRRVLAQNIASLS